MPIAFAYTLIVLLIITSILLTLLILLHRGKGGGLSSMFGGAASASLSGSSVVEKNLNRLTIFTALIWTVCIVGLGILQVRTRAARTGRNPATGEEIQIKASKKVAFRPAKELKDAV